MNNSIKNTADPEITINEIFYSIQGESSYSGKPCIFIRLTYCNLRCSYCDTEYAFFEGRKMTISQILAEISGYKCDLVEITGGEPLIQENVYPLMTTLCDKGYTVLLETGGHMDISPVDNRVIKIMDLKCPGSGESQKNHYENISKLKTHDEIKFVISDKNDYDWTKQQIKKYNLTSVCTVVLSPVFGIIDLEQLAGWILSDNLEVKLQLQLHKYIWSPEKRGV